MWFLGFGEENVLMWETEFETESGTFHRPAAQNSGVERTFKHVFRLGPLLTLGPAWVPPVSGLGSSPKMFVCPRTDDKLFVVFVVRWEPTST